MERRWHERYPQKFRCRAVERMNACDNIVRLARELHICRTLLYKWRHRLDPANGQAPTNVAIRNSRESTLRRQIDRLKRLLANNTLEVDFFRTALQKVEAQGPGKSREVRKSVSCPGPNSTWQLAIKELLRSSEILNRMAATRPQSLHSIAENPKKDCQKYIPSAI